MTLSIDVASEQLDRTLAFFPRVDGKASGLFAINSAMLGVLAARFEPTDLTVWYTSLSAVLAISALIYSFAQLYLCAYPQLKGGGGSYVYFQPIAARTESNFVDDFTNLDEKAWLRDLAAQIWRNSEILSAKFAALKHAFIATLIALAPWALAISFTGFES